MPRLAPGRSDGRIPRPHQERNRVENENPDCAAGVVVVRFRAGGGHPLRDFFRNPEQSNFTVSPDGRSVAFLSPWESRRNIVVRRPGQPDKRVTAIKDRDLSGYFWKGNDRLVYVKDNAGDENFHLYSVDLKSGKTRDLTPFPACAPRSSTA